MSPTTSRGTTQSAQEQEAQLAKSQLGFIDAFAEPLWNIGAQVFFPGMMHGVVQIKENRQVWMAKIRPPTTQATHNDGAGSSFSTTESGATTMKSEGTVPTPRTQSGVTPGGEVRKIASSSDLPDKPHKKNVRKQRSFSSLVFWRKKNSQKLKLRND